MRKFYLVGDKAPSKEMSLLDLANFTDFTELEFEEISRLNPDQVFMMGTISCHCTGELE